MISRITSQWRRFVGDESGATYVIGFVLWFPFVFFTLISMFEIGFYTARSTMLERGLDVVTRDIRLTTGFTPSHDEIKQRICNETNLIPNCAANLRLEMMVRNPRSWEDVPSTANCTDRSLPLNPVREFSPGKENELMILRACAKFKTLFGYSLFANTLEKDTSGDHAIIATTIFVQEPR